jgi:hypothetical protein
MASLGDIYGLLARVRRRMRIEAGLRHAAWAAAALVVAFTLLALVATHTGPASYWPVITTTVLLLFTVFFLAFGVVLPWRRSRTDTSVAHHAGRVLPELSSDLRSAVAFGEVPPATASMALVDAFCGTVAARLDGVPPSRIVPLGRAARAGAVFFAAAVAVTTVGLAARARLSHGLNLLVRRPTLFEGAAVTREPLVADIRITYHHPAYTGLPDRHVEGSSGDVVALKGTRLELEMRALRSARRALIFFGEHGEAGQVEAQVKDGRLRASFTVSESGRYRVWLAPLIGRPVREERGHRIEAASDQAPVVDIKAAADRIELPSPRPVEVGYAAADDYGLGPVDLVYRIGAGPEQRIPLDKGDGKKNVEGRTQWDPSNEALVPGVQIAYRIEAHDRDDVSGSKSGTSRTLYLVLERPRESVDESLASQTMILETLVQVLAERLELHEAVKDGRRAGLGDAPDPGLMLSRWQEAHDTEIAQVALVGGLVDEERRAGKASKTLLTALAKIAGELDRHIKIEGPLLTALRTRAETQGAPGMDALARLQKPGVRHVESLEDAVLLLDDLIGRQRLEDLASLGEQLTQAHKRLEDLLARYRASKDEALREQLLREVQELSRRIGELAAKIAAVKERNEISTEWQNMPDPREAMQKAREMQDLLERGGSADLEEALSRLGRTLESLQKQLEGNASDFADERFPRESKALAELSRKIADLESDERRLAEDTQKLDGELERMMDQVRQQKQQELMGELESKMADLKKRVQGRAPRRLGEDVSDDHDTARESAERAGKSLRGKEMAEAQREAEAAAEALERASAGAERKARREQGGQRDATAAYAEQMSKAGALAKEIAETLGQMMPQPGQVASEGQRAEAQGLGQRQRSIERQTRAMAEQAAREGAGMPGFEQAMQELRAAAEQMQQAQQSLAKGDPRDALGKEQGAADRLQRLRESLQNEKMGRSGARDPVRIPGADDSKAPRAWRQELMDAMREKAPEAYREEVRKYYEELVK